MLVLTKFHCSELKFYVTKKIFFLKKTFIIDCGRETLYFLFLENQLQLKVSVVKIIASFSAPHKAWQSILTYRISNLFECVSVRVATSTLIDYGARVTLIKIEIT